jgi:hypothetical protein
LDSTEGSFLYNTTRSLYEQTGFNYDRPKGKNHCVMRRTVSAAKKLDGRASGDILNWPTRR